MRPFANRAGARSGHGDLRGAGACAPHRQGGVLRRHAACFSVPTALYLAGSRTAEYAITLFAVLATVTLAISKFLTVRALSSRAAQLDSSSLALKLFMTYTITFKLAQAMIK